MTSTPPPAGDLAGRQLGDYLILRRLGSGGMADVYLAEQQSLGRQIALKVLRGDLALDANSVARFQNEARAAAQLVHPNIVQIYDVGQADGIYYIAQEYVPGKNLGELVQRQGALEPGLVLDVLRQAAAALSRAVELGIVHRDIKPENLLMSHSGEVKVADFGLARLENSDSKTLTQVGVAMGTPLYMSPEQIEGETVDVRSDLYSLGITGYHLLSGYPPYRGETALAVAVQHLKTPPQPLENQRSNVPSGLARIIHQLMAKKPADRYAAPAMLLADLRDLATEAAQQGWGDGPEGWSLADRIGASDTKGDAAGQLGALMQQSAELDSSGAGWIGRALFIVVALAAGMALGALTRPRFLLADAARPRVEKAESAWGQIYRASRAPSEAAWLAVEENFPDEDPYVYAQAKQGLVRYYLYLSEEYEKALVVLRELGAMSGQDERQESLQAFTIAALVIANEQLDNKVQAREANARLTSEHQDYLQRSDSRLFQMLQASLRRLR